MRDTTDLHQLGLPNKRDLVAAFLQCPLGWSRPKITKEGKWVLLSEIESSIKTNLFHYTIIMYVSLVVGIKYLNGTSAIDLVNVIIRSARFSGFWHILTQQVIPVISKIINKYYYVLQML